MVFPFKGEINNWDDWSSIFQSIPSFLPIIKLIFYNEKLPFCVYDNRVY